MAIFALSDLHLPLGINKPMDIFGVRWDNYVEKIEYEWKNTVKEEDFVIINGDFSWATYLSEALADFQFLQSLPGKKIISKGNHDYWWETLTKMNEFLRDNDISDVVFLQNNAVLCDGIAVCGARGWISPADKTFKKDDEKIYKRELLRLETSLQRASELSDIIIAALHYPPDEAYMEVIEKYNVYRCVFGHLHGKRAEDYSVLHKKCMLVSADFLKFAPIRII
ncbi:MAG: serine/threonine protein phosphatase [Ruminococcaceae bacterium]|nr:serine/threonine protein phosphatase [Oscillospiraceae bacterium]